MTSGQPEEPEHEPNPEQVSEDEELVFEEMDAPAPGPPRTAPAEAPFFAGQILGGRFEIVAALEESASSQHVQARDRVRGGADLALEVVRRDLLARIDELPERIQVVVPRLKELSHDAIDPLLDFGMLPDGRLYFASQLLSGRSLADLLANNEPLTSEEAFAVTRRVLRALEYGLSVDQVHGSLQPSNVFFEQGAEDLEHGVRLLGFGRASLLAPSDMRPTPRRDLQAVGPLLAQMLVGRPVHGHLHTWWEANAPALSRAEAVVVQNALLSARGEGYSGVKEFREAIEALPALRGEQGGGLKRLTWMAVAAGALGAAAVWFVNQDRTYERFEREAQAATSEERDAAGDEPARLVTPADADAADPGVDGTDPSVRPAAGMLRDLELVQRIEDQVARLRDGIDVTNEAVVDLRATTQALGARIDGFDERLQRLERGASGADGPRRSAPVLPLPDEASPALRAAATALFDGPASPFGPVGARAVHHTRSADGEEGWLVVTVQHDETTPTGAERSWVLGEEYFSAEGRRLGSRTVRVVQRDARFEEVDGDVYGLLDLADPWIELSTGEYAPPTDVTPPPALGVPHEALERFRVRVEASPTIALLEVDGRRRSWFVPGLGFVRYEDPDRIRRELVVLQER